MFLFFDHTGDVGVHVAAPTLDLLFADAAMAMTDAITPLSGVAAHERDTIALEAGELDLLMVDWLSELLFRFETRQALVGTADVTIAASASYALRATVGYETADAARHPIKILIKAVTYHGLDVRREGDLWRATIIFDI